MATFVSAEYLIANLLIAKKEAGISEITIEELSKCGVFVQQLSIEKNAGVILLSSAVQLTSAIFDFSDYFDYSYSENGGCIKINSSQCVEDLRSRFMGYLPSAVSEFMVKAVHQFAG